MYGLDDWMLAWKPAAGKPFSDSEPHSKFSALPGAVEIGPLRSNGDWNKKFPMTIPANYSRGKPPRTRSEKITKLFILFYTHGRARRYRPASGAPRVFENRRISQADFARH